MAALLRHRTLLAGTAIAALALTGCVQDPEKDDGGSTDESSSQETAAATTAETAEAEPSEEPSDEPSEEGTEPADDASADSEPSESPSADVGAAPSDLTEGEVSDALSTEIDGHDLVGATPAQVAASGTSVSDALSEEVMGAGFAVSPATCEEPFMTGFLGGLHKADDTVLAVDADGALLLTAEVFPDADAAQKALDEERGAVEDCSKIRLTADGDTADVKVSTDDLEVEGASEAYEITLSGGDTDVTNPSMAYGNVVVTVATTAQFEGGSAPDPEVLLTEVAEALSEA